MEWGCIIIEMSIILYCDLCWCWHCIFYQNSIF